LDKCL